MRRFAASATFALLILPVWCFVFSRVARLKPRSAAAVVALNCGLYVVFLSPFTCRYHEKEGDWPVGQYWKNLLESEARNQ